MTTSADPVASAIATAGVSTEPSSLHSEAIHHKTALDDLDNLAPADSQQANGKVSVSKDVEEDDDGPVVFDASHVLMAPNGAAPTTPGMNPKPSHTRRRSATGDSPKGALSVGRASLESLSFGYRDHLLPLTLSGADDGWDEYDQESHSYDVRDSSRGASARSAGGVGRSIRREERRVGLIDGIALTVGLQIGSGIFSSPGVVTLNTGSIGASLVVWLMSGVLAWTGASSYAELGAAIPLNGGAQAYLGYSFGPLMAYLFSWSAIVCLKPGSGAIIATIFGEYLARVLYHSVSSSSADPHEQGLANIPDWSVKLIAILVIIIITLLHVLSSKLGTRTQIATTIVKLGALIAVPVLAIVKAARGGMPDASKEAFVSFSSLFAGSATWPSAYALALYSGLWAFDGWDQTSYVAGEMNNVKRDLPRVIHCSLTIVLLMFLSESSFAFVRKRAQSDLEHTFCSNSSILLSRLTTNTRLSNQYSSSRLWIRHGRQDWWCHLCYPRCFLLLWCSEWSILYQC